MGPKFQKENMNYRVLRKKRIVGESRLSITDTMLFHVSFRELSESVGSADTDANAKQATE